MKQNRILTILTCLFLTFWALIVLFPFYWMALTSVKDYGAYNAEYIPKFFTLSPTLQNYADAFTAVPLGKYLLNTLIFALVTTGLKERLQNTAEQKAATPTTEIRNAKRHKL